MQIPFLDQSGSCLSLLFRLQQVLLPFKSQPRGLLVESVLTTSQQVQDLCQITCCYVTAHVVLTRADLCPGFCGSVWAGDNGISLLQREQGASPLMVKLGMLPRAAQLELWPYGPTLPFFHWAHASFQLADLWTVRLLTGNFAAAWLSILASNNWDLAGHLLA